MDCDKARKWVDKNMPKLKRKLGLHHWLIYTYDKAMEDCRAQCTALNRYEKARIYIDYDRIEDVEELDQVLTHELLHIVHSPFNEVWDSLSKLIPDQHTENALFEVMALAQELTVLNLERMVKGLEDV